MYLRMSLQHAGKFKNEWEDSEEGGWMLLVSRGIRGSRNFIWNERYGNKQCKNGVKANLEHFVWIEQRKLWNVEADTLQTVAIKEKHERNVCLTAVWLVSQHF